MSKQETEAASTPFQIWDALPDVLLFNIVSFVAARTHRSSVLCHCIGPLCRASYKAILQQPERPLWDIVLKEDYGGLVEHHDQQRRACKRLRRSPVHRVREAHLRIKDNTEIAFFFLSEMTNVTGNTKKNALTRNKLCRLLDEYGPHLRINEPVSSGGVYLVEVCRARNVRESVVLRCVEELVGKRGAVVDAKTNEAAHSSQTALSVAAARGMSSVVRYLVCKAQADRQVRSSGRFRLQTQPKKTVRCIDATPLEFAVAMRNAELEAGAAREDLVGLAKCIQMLGEPF